VMVFLSLEWPNFLKAMASTKKPYRHSTVRLRCFGADEVNRTPDPHITNVLLYRLSYIGDKQPL
jgi:hypothetical protein